MLKIIFLLASTSILLIGCGTPIEENDTPTLPDINYGKYATYVTNFIALAKANGIDTSKPEANKLRIITVVDDDQIQAPHYEHEDLAECKMADDYNSITIRKSFAENASLPLFQWAMYHELGHCILNAQHTSEFGNDLMSTYTPDEVVMADDDSDIVQQLTKEFMDEYAHNKIQLLGELNTQPANFNMAPIVTN